MTSGFAKDQPGKDPSPHADPNIVSLTVRRRLRQCVENLLELASSRVYTVGGMMRLVADATATYGDALVDEVQRSMVRNTGDALRGIALMRIIASPRARRGLWQIANDSQWSSAITTEALWALYRLGERVPPGRIIASAPNERPSEHHRDTI